MLVYSWFNVPNSVLVLVLCVLEGNRHMQPCTSCFLLQDIKIIIKSLQRNTGNAACSFFSFTRNFTCNFKRAATARQPSQLFDKNQAMDFYRIQLFSIVGGQYLFARYLTDNITVGCVNKKGISAFTFNHAYDQLTLIVVLSNQA